MENIVTIFTVIKMPFKFVVDSFGVTGTEQHRTFIHIYAVAPRFIWPYHVSLMLMLAAVADGSARC